MTKAEAVMGAYPFAEKARILAAAVGASEVDLWAIESALREAFAASSAPPPPQAPDAVCNALRDLADRADRERWRRDTLATELRALAHGLASGPRR